MENYKYLMKLGFFRIFCAKNYEYWFRFLQVTEGMKNTQQSLQPGLCADFSLSLAQTGILRGVSLANNTEENT